MPETQTTISINTEAVNSLNESAGAMFNHVSAIAGSALGTLEAIAGLEGSVPAKAKCPALAGAVAKARAALAVLDYLGCKTDLDQFLNQIIDLSLQCDNETADYFAAILESINTLGLQETELTDLINYRTNTEDFADYARHVQEIWSKYGSLEGKGTRQDLKSQFIKGLDGRGFFDTYAYSYDPVNLCTGNFICQRTDLRLRAAGTDLEIKRTYNAMGEGSGILGKGWSTNLEETITKEGGAGYLNRGDGGKEPFLPVETQEKAPAIKKYRSVISPERELLEDEEGFLLIDTENTARRYGREGTLISIHSKKGGIIRLHHEQGRPVLAETVTGESITLSYDENNRLELLTDHSGRTVSYHYDARGRLAAVTGTDGRTQTYAYDGKDRLTAIHTPEGTKTVENEYDEKDRVTRQTFPDGGTMTYEYKENTVTMTERDGSRSIYHHDKEKRHTMTEDRAGTEKYTYTPAGMKYSGTDQRGNTTRYTYDKENRLTAVVDAGSGRTKYCYNQKGQMTDCVEPDGTKKSCRYDEEGKLLEERDPSGLLCRYIHDEKGQISELRLGDGSALLLRRDPRGNLTEVVENGNILRYAYDSLNRMVSMEDAMGSLTAYAYDAKDRITGITNAEGNTRNITCHANGKPAAITDFDGTTKKYQYNSFNRLSAITDQNGNRTEYACDAMGNCISVHYPDGTGICCTRDFKGNITRIVDEENKELRFDYDACGNCTKITDQEGNTYIYAYDKENRLISAGTPEGKETRWTYNRAGRLVKTQGPDGKETTYTYDGAGRIIKAEDSEGNEETCAYHFRNLISRVERNGRLLLENTYAPGGILLKRKYGNGYEETYTHDRGGNLTGIKDNRGYEALYEYDSMNRPIRYKDNMGKDESVSYDPCGRIKETGTAGKWTRRFHYGKDGKLLTAEDAEGMKVSYGYDLRGNLKYILQREEGDPFGETMTEEDWIQAVRQNEQNGQNRQNGQNGRSPQLHLTEFIRNRRGEITAIKDALGREETWERDKADGETVSGTGKQPAGQPTRFPPVPEEIKQELMEQFSHIHDGTGRITGIRFPGNIRAEFTYEGPAVRVLAYYRGEELLDRFRCTYGQDNRLETAEIYRKDLPKASGTYSYSHDKSGRLVKVEKDGKPYHAYGYDGFGNRIYSMEEGVETTYSYDVLNRLTGMTRDGVRTEFCYDENGNVTGEETVDTDRQSADRGIGNEDMADGNTESSSVPRGFVQTPFAFLRKSESGEGWEIILRDPMGSAVRALNAKGETAEASAYDPFGKETERYEGVAEGNGFHSPFGFGGYKKTGKKDIYRTLAREYNGDIGRFQTGDSEMYIHPYVPVSANLYQYAWNSPLKYADPMGRDVEESEWERYLELGLTGYVKYGYHMIIDYMPDELMLVSGAMNPLVMTGTMAEAQLNGRWDELDYLLITNNRAYSHGYTEGFWDFTLGNLEGMIMKPFNDLDRMGAYVGDVFSGRNTDNWLMTGAKLISMPMQFASGIPIYDSLDRADEDIEKAKNVAKTVWRVAQMNPVEQAEATLRAGAAIYNHYNAVFHSEEGVAQLFYKGGYGVGTVTGIAADVIVGNAVAKELMQIGGEIGGKLRGIRNVESSTDIFDDVKRIDEIKVEFNYNSQYDEAEFARQLAEQQKGMNELTVQEYLDNRQQYITQGRAVESNAAQQVAREKAFIDKVDELQDAGLSLREAEEQAQNWLNTQAALHNPDQVAGGNAGNIGGMGDKGVNSSIGSQWRYRIDAVDSQVEKMAENMSEVERNSTYLNVNLTYEGE